MILVRSRRLLLSGSSLVLLLLLIFVLDSCTKKTTPQSHDDRADISRDTVERAADDAPTIDEIADQIDTTKLRLKDSYNITMLLPLFLDSVYLYDKDSIPENRKSVYRRSTMALSFYKGAVLALEQLQKSGFNATVTILDTKNSMDVVKKYIKSGKLDNQDLIIGPIYNNNLRLVADYMKKQKQYIISPLSPADNITANNPYYIMVNPSLDVHINKIFNYTLNNFSQHNLLLYYQHTDFENKNAAMLQKLLQTYVDTTADTSLYFTAIVDTPLKEDEYAPPREQVLEELRSYFKMDTPNLVIIPSIDKTFILDASRRLFSLTEEYDITVMGMPVWEDNEGLRIDYINELNVHFTSSYLASPEMYNTKDTTGFMARYIAEYNSEPGEFEIKGYDVMMYFGRLLMQFGLDYDKYMTESQWTGQHATFSFKPHYVTTTLDTNKSEVDFIENKYVHLLRYKDYSIVKIR